MNSPNEKVLRALINLEGSPDFVEFIGWLKECSDSKKAEIIDTIDDVRLRWAQGKLQMLEAVIEVTTKPRIILANSDRKGFRHG